MGRAVGTADHKLSNGERWRLLREEGGCMARLVPASADAAKRELSRARTACRGREGLGERRRRTERADDPKRRLRPCRIPIIQAAGCSPTSLRPSLSRAMLLTSRDPNTFFCTYCECSFQHDADGAGTPVTCPSCEAGLAAAADIPAVHRALRRSSIPTLLWAVRPSPARPRAQQRPLPQAIVLRYWQESVWEQALKPALNTARVAGLFGVIGAFRIDGTLFERYISWAVCSWSLLAVGFAVAYLVAVAVYAAARLATASAGRSQSLPSAYF